MTDQPNAWAWKDVARAIDAARLAGFREGIEAAAEIADKYADHPCSGDNNNTLSAFYAGSRRTGAAGRGRRSRASRVHAGMDHRAGATDNAMVIRDAIRVLAPPRAEDE